MSFGFLAVVGVWSLLAFLVVFPTAFLAGFQFPLLIALFGKGQKGVAQDLGRAYLWNTTGSILGSLLGGFGLLPLLSATGVWRMNIILLLVLAAATALFAITRTQRFSPALGLLGAGGVALFFCISPGPGKIWRHTPIGAQRFQLSPLLSTNQKQDILNRYKRTIIWQKDGVELGLGMRAGSALSFIVNGKNDGNAINDAVTSIALGWLGTVLHQQPKRALVIGLGTGATAGWLARAPGIERVDVFELEPAIEKVARRSTHVNEDLFNNPKVHLHYADAREVLLAIPKKYDLIISAPSNPFRAGIVSLFTREFYQSVKKRLRPGGILVQWIQGYEVGPETIQTTLATLQAEFENVETWEAKLGADLLLVASPKPLRYTYESLKERMKHPYHDRAIRTIWGVTGVHGLLTGYVGNHKLTKELAKAHVGDLNTDDFPRIEFGLVGHMIDKTRRFSVGMLYQLAGKLGMDRPSFGERIDWGKVDELRAVRGASTRSIIPPSRSSDRDVQRRIAARQAFLQNRPHKARALWKWGKDKPLSSFDRLLLSSLFYKKAKAAGWLARLRKHHKTDVLFLDAFHALTKGQLKTSTTLLQKGFLQARTNPWVYRPLLELAMDQAALVGRRDAVLGRMLFKTLQVPFSTMLVDDLRRRNLIKMAVNTDFYGLCRAAFVALEPHIPWTKDALERRWLCYDAHKHPLRAKAYEDLKRFVKQRVTAMRHHVYRYVPLGPPPKPRRWRPVPKPRAVARQILPRKVLPLRKPKAASRPSVPASVPTSQPTR